VRAAPDHAGTALELARLALRVAELVPEDGPWRLALQGFVWAFVANAQRVGSDLLAAAESFATAWRLWRAAGPAAAGPLGAEDPQHLLGQGRDLGAAAVLEVEDRQLQGDEGGVIGVPALRELPLRLVEECARRVAPSQAGGNPAADPQESLQVEAIAQLERQLAERRQACLGIPIPPEVGEHQDAVDVEHPAQARLGGGVDQRRGLLERGQGGVDLIGLLQRVRLVEQDAPAGQTLTIIDSTLQASGNGTNVGINVTGGANTFAIVRTSAAASTGTSYGLAEVGGSGINSYTIDHSQVTGATGSVHLGSSFSAGASQPAGAVSAASATCAACYNGSYSALSATCH
jgi:hypothetical protein